MPDNVFHISVHKCASQWYEALLRHELLQKYLDYDVQHYETDLKNPLLYMQHYFTHAAIVPAKHTWSGTVSEARRARHGAESKWWRIDPAARFEPIPENSCICGLYTSYQKFKHLVSTDNFKGFYAIRDPREILVSAYKHFTLRESHRHAISFFRNFILAHPEWGLVIEISDQDFEMAKKDDGEYSYDYCATEQTPQGVIEHVKMGLYGGFEDYMTNNNVECEEERKQICLRAMIDILTFNLGLYPSMHDWATNCKDDRILMIKNEDFLLNYKTENFEKLFDHLEFNMSKNDIVKIYDDMRYEKFSEGRALGEENNNHHYRSGTSDTWKKELNDETLDYFYKKTGNLIDVLQYDR
jgi:hypothetical protein